MKYALIENNAVTEVRNMASNFVAADVAHKFDLRVVNIQPTPDYDAATHKTGDWDYTINADSVDAVRSVVALSQAELDANADNALNEQEREQAKALYQALKAGTATNNQAQRVLAYLLKNTVGDAL